MIRKCERISHTKEDSRKSQGENWVPTKRRRLLVMTMVCGDQVAHNEISGQKNRREQVQGLDRWLEHFIAGSVIRGRQAWAPRGRCAPPGLSGSDGKESAYDAGDPDSIPGSGRSPGGGNGNPLEYSCLGNPMDRGAWLATVCVVTEADMTEQPALTFIQRILVPTKR